MGAGRYPVIGEEHAQLLATNLDTKVLYKDNYKGFLGNGHEGVVLRGLLPENIVELELVQRLCIVHLGGSVRRGDASKEGSREPGK